MKIKYIIWSIFLFFIHYGCYDDKGNYDYTEINSITFTEFQSNWGYYIGDTVHVVPKLAFKLDSVNVDLSYEWQLEDGRVLGHEKELFYVSDRLGEPVYMSLRVRDNKTNMEYIGVHNVSVYPRYGDGWTILSEKNGKAMLSYFAVNYKWDDNDNRVFSIKEYPDIYKEKNGEELGGRPYKIHEFFSDWNSTSHLAVVQEGGIGTVYMEGTTFKKTILAEQEFMTGKYPAGFQPKDAFFGNNANLLLGTNGDLYVKKNDNIDAYYTGRYPDFPLYFEGGLDVSHLIRTKFNDSNFSLVFDKKNNRFLAIIDGDESVSTQGNIVNMFLDPSLTPDPSFTPLDKMGDVELLYCGYSSEGSCWNNAIFFDVFFNKKDNKYYMQKFYVEFGAYTTGVVIYAPRYQKEFPGQHLLNGKNIFAVVRDSRQMAFFSSGEKQDKLYGYIFDDGKDTPHLLYDFKGEEITALYALREWGSERTLGVATASGKFYLMDVDISAFKNGSTILVQSKSDLGRIVDIHYKCDSQSSFLN